MVLAWENLRRFLFIFVHFVVVVVHLSSFVDVFHFVGSFNFQATLPCHRHSTLASQTYEGLHLSSTPTTLDCLFFFITASATVLSGHFLPTGVFYLKLLPDIFGTFPTFWHIPDILAQPAFIKVLLGVGSYFLESCRTSC